MADQVQYDPYRNAFGAVNGPIGGAGYIPGISGEQMDALRRGAQQVLAGPPAAASHPAQFTAQGRTAPLSIANLLNLNDSRGSWFTGAGPTGRQDINNFFQATGPQNRMGSSEIGKRTDEIAGSLGGQGLIMNLLNQGHLPPQMLNMLLADQERGFQGAQQDLGAQMGASGFGQTGAGNAIQAALTAAQGEQRGRTIMDEQQAAHDRYREDIMSALDMITRSRDRDAGLQQQAMGINAQNSSNSRARSDQRRQQMIQAGIGLAMAFCWIARAVYGTQDDTWLRFRSWMLTHGPVEEYITHGPTIAEEIGRNPEMKAHFKSRMDTILENWK